MRSLTLTMMLLAVLIPSLADAKPPQPLGFWGRAKVRAAPMRVHQTPRGLSKVSLGLANKRPIVKAVARKLSDGRLVFKQYGYKVVGNKTHRSVFSTVVSPDGSAKSTLQIKGLMRKSWGSHKDYKMLARELSSGRAKTSAVMVSPLTRGGLLLVPPVAMASMPGVSAAMALKAMFVPAVYGAGVVLGSSDSQMKPNVQSLQK